MNAPANLRVGTEGRPSPGDMIRITRDGEIFMADVEKVYAKARK